MICSRLLASLLVLGISAGARAQTVPPQPLPQVPDEPLPEWHPPAKRSVAMFLTLSPDMVQAQKLRQAGLWISSIGWLQFFASGILYATAADANDTLSRPHATGLGNDGQPIISRTFDPAQEDKRNALENSALSLAIIGGAMAVGGFVMFTAGQAHISSYHKRHPKEPLPPLSGY